jgi:hypothetical protein
MISQAKLEANKNNARKSTGPRTEEGKKKVRFNALRHGMAAETIVLPHEDVKAFEQRRDSWARELNAPGELGGYLAERAVRLSWQLDRADAQEWAELAERVHKAPAERERSRRRRATESVRLVLAKDTDDTSRADRLARLSSSTHGCTALLEAWASVQQRLEARGVAPIASANGDWVLAVWNPILRLLGIAGGPEARAAMRADQRLWRIIKAVQIARGRDSDDHDGADEIPPLESMNECIVMDELWAVVKTEQLQLRTLLEDHRASESNQAAEDAAAVAFDGSPEGERVHRYQGQWGRALIQTLDAIRKLKRDVVIEEPAEEVSPAPSPVVPEPANPPVATATAAAPEQTHLWQSGCQARRCRICVAGFPHIPFAVGFGRSGWSRTGRRTIGSCAPQHIP